MVPKHSLLTFRPVRPNEIVSKVYPSPGKLCDGGYPAVFGNTQFSIPAADVVLGDPFEEAGSDPVYDLVAGE